MITPGWRKRNDVCPVCHMPGRVGERLYDNGEGCDSVVMKDMELTFDVCDNCGVVYCFKADKAEIPELSKERMEKAGMVAPGNRTPSQVAAQKLTPRQVALTAGYLLASQAMCLFCETPEGMSHSRTCLREDRVAYKRFQDSMKEVLVAAVQDRLERNLADIISVLEPTTTSPFANSIASSSAQAIVVPTPWTKTAIKI